MSGPMRILHIVGAMYPGGVENFIMNLYRRIDRDRFQFDFIVHQRREDDYVPEIEVLGGRVYELPRLTGHPAANLRGITALVRENGYAVVIRHTANALVAPQLLSAKRGGAVTVCHSHSSDDPRRVAHRLGRFLLPQTADVRLACSEQAGYWMYGKHCRPAVLPLGKSEGTAATALPSPGPEGTGTDAGETFAGLEGTGSGAGEAFEGPEGMIPAVKGRTEGPAVRGGLRQAKGTFHIIRNAVDLNRFSYDSGKAQHVRRELGIRGRHVYGHVGNYIEVKNHPYLLRIYREIVNREPDAVCLCVGEGELRPQLEAQVKELHLENNVILTGLRGDVDALMSAMDVLLFPSVFEGLPLTLIEAQAAGLPMLISDSITRDVAVTKGLVEWRPITEEPALWAERAMELAARGTAADGAITGCITEATAVDRATTDFLTQRKDARAVCTTQEPDTGPACIRESRKGNADSVTKTFGHSDRACQRENIAAAGYDLDELVQWYETFFDEIRGSRSVERG